MGRLNQIAAETRGSEVAEAALVLPLVFTLLLGIFWVGRAYNIYATINHAAREGARVAASSSCATCGNIVLPGDQVAQNYVAPILQASGLDPRLVTYQTPNFCVCGTPTSVCGTPVPCDSAGTGATPSICIQRNVDLGVPNYSPLTCGTAVSFQYPFQLPLPFAPPSVRSLTITTQVKARTEN
jgi:Flp pilus assembly protein TadG